MDRTRIPAQLPDDVVERWRRLILSEHENERELREDIANKLGKSSESVRSPLSRLLNGDGREICHWLEPNKYGEALCDLLGIQCQSLAQQLVAMLPVPKPQGLTSAHLDRLSLGVRLRGLRFTSGSWSEWLRVNAASWLKSGDEEVSTWAQVAAELEALARRAGVATNPQPRIQIRRYQPSLWRDDFKDNALASRLGMQRLAQLVGRHPQLQLEDGGDIVLELEFLPLTSQALRDWLEGLANGELISRHEAQRLEDALGVADPERLFMGCSPEHIIYACQDILGGDEGVFQEGLFQRRRAEWLRREMSTAASPMARLWLGQTHDFFLRWVMTSRSLRTEVTAAELDQILGITSRAVTEELAYEALDIALIEDPEARTAEAARLLAKLPTELKEALHESDLLQKRRCSDATRWSLSPGMQELGAAELIFHIEPEALEHIDLVDHYETLVQSAQLADPRHIERWVSQAIAVDSVEQPDIMLAVLAGIARRDDRAETLHDDMLVCLWASVVWSILTGLHRPSVGTRFIRTGERHALHSASEAFADRLPRLEGAEGPLKALERFVAPQILEACERWRPLNRSLTDEPWPARLGDAGERFHQTELVNPRDVADMLVRLAPFQMPFDLLEQVDAWSPGEFTSREVYERVVRHLARTGCRRARHAFLLESIPPVWNTRSELDIREIMQWWTSTPIDESNSRRYEYDFQNALEEYRRAPDSGLRQVLHANAVKAPPAFVSEVVELGDAVRRCSEEAIRLLASALCHEKFSGLVSEHLPFHSRVLMLAEILDDRALLKWLASLSSELLSKTPDLLEAWTLTEDSRKHLAPKFSCLEKLARLRHEALILLARMGEFEPLRASLDARWTVQSARIGNTRRVWAAISNAMRGNAKHTAALPAIDDELWAEILDSILIPAFEQSLENLRTNNIEFESLRARSQQRTIYRMALRTAPCEARWELLGPGTSHLWSTRYCTQLEQFWARIEQAVAALETGSDFWKEPQEWLTERRDWALNHDEGAIRRWCEQNGIGENCAMDVPSGWLDSGARCAIEALARDLDGRGQATWPYLNVAAQRCLLLAIPSDVELPRLWWDRRGILTPEELIKFAKNHGTPQDVLDAQRAWIAHGGDARARLERWCQLPAPRPHPGFLADDARTYFEEVKPVTSKHGIDRSICFAMLHSIEQWRDVLGGSIVEAHLVPVLAELLYDQILYHFRSCKESLSTKERADSISLGLKLERFVPELTTRKVANDLKDRVRALAHRRVVSPEDDGVSDERFEQLLTESFQVVRDEIEHITKEKRHPRSPDPDNLKPLTVAAFKTRMQDPLPEGYSELTGWIIDLHFLETRMDDIMPDLERLVTAAERAATGSTTPAEATRQLTFELSQLASSFRSTRARTLLRERAEALRRSRY